MKLYLIWQEQNNDLDTYDSAVVCAPNEETARNIHPRTGDSMTDEDWSSLSRVWCSSASKVKVRYLGEAHESIEQGLILSSFNAG